MGRKEGGGEIRRNVLPASFFFQASKKMGEKKTAIEKLIDWRRSSLPIICKGFNIYVQCINGGTIGYCTERKGFYINMHGTCLFPMYSFPSKKEYLHLSILRIHSLNDVMRQRLPVWNILRSQIGIFTTQKHQFGSKIDPNWQPCLYFLLRQTRAAYDSGFSFNAQFYFWRYFSPSFFVHNS